MSLLVLGAYRAEATIHGRLEENTIKTIGVTSRCSQKLAKPGVDLSKHQWRGHFAAEMSASASFAMEHAMVITHK